MKNFLIFVLFILLASCQITGAFEKSVVLKSKKVHPTWLEDRKTRLSVVPPLLGGKEASTAVYTLVNEERGHSLKGDAANTAIEALQTASMCIRQMKGMRDLKLALNQAKNINSNQCFYPNLKSSDYYFELEDIYFEGFSDSQKTWYDITLIYTQNRAP